MSTDPAPGRQGCWTASIVVAITLLIGSLPFLLLLGNVLVGSVQIDATRHALLNDIDHLAVRDAGREFLSVSSVSGFIDVSQLPQMLRDLEPQTASVHQHDQLLLEFGGGFHHHGLLIVAPCGEVSIRNDQHVGLTPLADGIWYYEDKK